MKTKQDVVAWLEENRQQFVDMANAIWEKPEIGFHEFFASKLQADFLEKEGFRLRRDVAGINTAFIAEWGAGHPIIGFTGEYDALPGLSQKCQPAKEALVEGGLGHGCGHNLLGTAHIASVAALKRWMEANNVQGTICYYGCPAEESGAAKTFMARAGLFDDLDAAFNYHPMYANMAMKGSMVGIDSIKFHFHGIPAHAGATPQLGRSALDAVELMNVGVNYLREHVTGDVRMHYTITNGGQAPNIVPEDAEVWYFIRAHQPDNLRDVVDRVRKIAEGAALMAGVKVEEIFLDAMSNVLNNRYLADLQYGNMQVIGPIQWTPEEIEFAKQINANYPPGNNRMNAASFGMPPDIFQEPLLGDNYASMDEGKLLTGSTDVGDLSWKTPLSMLSTASYTTGSPGHSWGIVATSGMSIGHKGMLHAAKIMALTAMDLLADPRHIAQARAEFERELSSHPYINPIPEHVRPPRFAE